MDKVTQRQDADGQTAKTGVACETAGQILSQKLAFEVVKWPC